MGNLRLFHIFDFELINVREWMTFGNTKLIDSRIRPFLAVFFYMFAECPGGLPYVRRFAIRVCV